MAASMLYLPTPRAQPAPAPQPLPSGTAAINVPADMPASTPRTVPPIIANESTVDVTGADGGSVKKPRITACIQCHVNKKKCVGGRPCGRCKELRKPCVQPVKPPGRKYGYSAKKSQRLSEEQVKAGQRIVDDCLALGRPIPVHLRAEIYSQVLSITQLNPRTQGTPPQPSTSDIQRGPGTAASAQSGPRPKGPVHLGAYTTYPAVALDPRRNLQASAAIRAARENNRHPDAPAGHPSISPSSPPVDLSIRPFTSNCQLPSPTPSPIDPPSDNLPMSPEHSRQNAFVDDDCVITGVQVAKPNNQPEARIASISRPLTPGDENSVVEVPNMISDLKLQTKTNATSMSDNSVEEYPRHLPYLKTFNESKSPPTATSACTASPGGSDNGFVENIIAPVPISGPDNQHNSDNVPKAMGRSAPDYDLYAQIDYAVTAANPVAKLVTTNQVLDDDMVALTRASGAAFNKDNPTGGLNMAIDEFGFFNFGNVDPAKPSELKADTSTNAYITTRAGRISTGDGFFDDGLPLDNDIDNLSSIDWLTDPHSTEFLPWNDEIGDGGTSFDINKFMAELGIPPVIATGPSFEDPALAVGGQKRQPNGIQESFLLPLAPKNVRPGCSDDTSFGQANTSSGLHMKKRALEEVEGSYLNADLAFPRKRSRLGSEEVRLSSLGNSESGSGGSNTCSNSITESTLQSQTGFSGKAAINATCSEAKATALSRPLPNAFSPSSATSSLSINIRASTPAR